MHLNQRDISDAVVTIKRDTSTVVPTTATQYNDKGESDEKRHDKFTNAETCSVLVKSGNNRFFKIKKNKKGHPYNPLKQNLSYGLDVPDKNSQELMFVLREVSESAFNAYLKFLETRYDSYLLAVQRS